MINTKTNEFIQTVTEMINTSGLPPVNVRMALELIYQQVIKAEKQAIEEEQANAAGQAAEPERME